MCIATELINKAIKYKYIRPCGKTRFKITISYHSKQVLNFMKTHNIASTLLTIPYDMLVIQLDIGVLTPVIVLLFTFKKSIWRICEHDGVMKTFSTFLAICAGNSPVPGEFPAQRPVTRSFDIFFDLRLNKRLSKQSRCW